MTMHTTLCPRHTFIAAALVAAGFAGSAQAASWDFSACSGTIATAQNWGTCGSATSEGLTPSIRGYSTVTGNAGTQVYAWSGSNGGLGYYANTADSGTGPHAVDNNGSIDSLILDFTQAVSLSSVKLGWNGTDDGQGTAYNDSDMSVYYWNGAGTPTISNGTALTFGDSAWKLVNHFTDVGGYTNETATFSTGSSSYWLISAYNGSVYSKGNDAFKLLAVAGSVVPTPPSGVPEPGSLALLGLGALGLFAARRKSVNKV